MVRTCISNIIPLWSRRRNAQTSNLSAWRGAILGNRSKSWVQNEFGSVPLTLWGRSDPLIHSCQVGGVPFSSRTRNYMALLSVEMPKKCWWRYSIWKRKGRFCPAVFCGTGGILEMMNFRRAKRTMTTGFMREIKSWLRLNFILIIIRVCNQVADALLLFVLLSNTLHFLNPTTDYINLFATTYSITMRGVFVSTHQPI